MSPKWSYGPQILGDMATFRDQDFFAKEGDFYFCPQRTNLTYQELVSIVPGKVLSVPNSNMTKT